MGKSAEERAENLRSQGMPFFCVEWAMANVLTACVVAVPHPKWDERPVAIVVPPEGVEAPSREEVCKFLEGSQFSKFQLPDDVITWKEIPMTGTGKMDKKNVRAALEKQGYVLPEFRKQPAAKL